MGMAPIDKDMVNLFIRMIVYSMILCISVVLMLYVVMDGHHKEDGFAAIGEEYITCLLLEFQLSLTEQEKLKIIKKGNLFEYFADQCVLDPNNDFPEFNVYHLNILVGVFLIGFASVVFSCSYKKYKQWKYVVICVISCGKAAEAEKNRKNTEIGLEIQERSPTADSINDTA